MNEKYANNQAQIDFTSPKNLGKKKEKEKKNKC